ncbi:type II secretion system F family protein [Methylosinus sp. H3A]|uniref:type II secretion system F family protein n=1 Tax=Methylosinus sp. H3A TaxID=2785786 RepID=UPI0018C335B1|nr:type II secretion system F family protein [Methylosinus sp. H3A]MBG0808325.1 type II secretion system F family protein [Methylosinus sp. H3A]
MSIFRYRAYSSTGDLIEGDIEARSSEDAEDALWRRGLTPLSLRETRAGGKGSLLTLQLGARKPSPADIASFTREFATLEQADVPLDHSLRLLATQSATPALRALADEILRRVVDGASLSDALATRTDLFGPDYISIVRAGETMGKAAQALADMADILERRLEMRARIQSGLVYPALLIVLAIVSTSVVLGTLVPNIAPIFVDSGQPMPAGLQFVIDVSANWRWGVGAIALLTALAVTLRRYAAASPDFGVRFDRALLALPYAGPLSAKLQTARFAYTLGSSLKAGVPLLQGLESARAVLSDRYFSAELAKVIETVRGGGALSAALERVERLPPTTATMTRIGEEAGRLDDMLLRLASMFERQTQRSLERAVGLVTPTLTILIAAVVGGLVMTMMDAVLGINDLALR